jgi:hypothetical protein
MIGQDFEYIGEFKEGECSGFGKLIEKDVEIYEGSFKNNMKHGNGRQEDLTSGLQYEGSWKENKKHGPGKVINSDKNQIIHGVWHMNQIVEVQFTTQIEAGTTDTPPTII